MTKNQQIKKFLALIGVILHNRQDMSFYEVFNWIHKSTSGSFGHLMGNIPDEQFIARIREKFERFLRKKAPDDPTDSAVMHVGVDED